MKHSNRLAAIAAGLLCALWLTACGEDQELTEYYDNMNTFFDHVAAINDEMNNIDRDAEDAQGELLSYLDELQTEITWMAGLETPEEFAAVESLAQEADENMQQAVALYHETYEAEAYDEATADAAKQYYDRANLRIQYIIMIFHGEIPEGEGVTYTEDDSILGGGYLNQEDGEEAGENADEDAGEDAAQPDDAEEGQSLEDE